MGNIYTGHHLLKHSGNTSGTGLTLPLLTNESGQKFGKSESAPVWLDPSETSPYEFYQYFYNTSDSQVGKLMRLLTLMPLGSIKQIEENIRNSNNSNNLYQKKLAKHLTLLVHGG